MLPQLNRNGQRCIGATLAATPLGEVMNRREISDAEMLAALLPNSPADLTATPAAMRDVAPLQLTVAYQPGPNGTLVPVYIPATLPVAPASQAVAVRQQASQPIPSWAKGTAIVAVGVGAGTWLLAGALDLVSSAVAGIAAGAAAALPLLVLAGVAVAALAGRKGTDGAKQDRSVSITQTFTNNIRIGE